MRRFVQLVTFITLVALVALPALQWRCAMACANVDTPAPVESCHGHHDGSASPLPALASRHECTRHPMSIAVPASERTTTAPAIVVTVPTVIAPEATASASIAATRSTVGGPPGLRPVPLRV